MTYKVWVHKLTFNLSRGIGWRLAAGLTLGLLLGAVMQAPRAGAGSQFAPAQAQEQDRIAAQRKYKEGEALRAQGTAESLRLAVKKYEEALPLWRAVGDRRSEAITLNNLGAAYFSLGEKRKSIEFFTQALPLHRAIGDSREEATTLNNIGSIYSSLGENQKALDYYNQSLRLDRALGNRTGAGTTLSNIGAAYDSLGEKQKALDFYTQSLPLLRAAGARGEEAGTLNCIGLIYSSLGENRKALDFYAQALPLRRAIGDRSGEGATLNNIGFAYFWLGESQKALDFYAQALRLDRAVNNRGGEARTLNNIGSAYNSLGENQKALDFFNQALPLLRAADDRSGEAATLNNAGNIYSSLGEKQKALDLYARALRLSRAAGDRREEGATLNNIGLAYSSLGEWQKAIDLYAQSLPLRRAVGDRNGEAATLNNIGGVYYSLGGWQKAIAFYAQALPLLRAVGARREEAATLNNIGLAYSSLGEIQKALEYYNQALPLSRAVGDRGGEAGTLSSIGLAYSSLGEKQKALDFCAQALTLFRALGYRIGEANTLGLIAIVKRSLGQFDESRSHVESALKIIEPLRAKVIIQELRSSYFATAHGFYEFYVDLLMQMHKREPAKGHDAAALQASERARARSLIESLTEARADIRKGVDPALLMRERALQQRLNAKADARLKLLNGPHTETQAVAFEIEINALTIELQQVRTQIRQTNQRYWALTQPQPLRLDEIQRQALDADTLLLEYSFGAERSFLWAVTPTSVDSYELPKREAIEAAAKRVYELLSDTSGVRGQAARPRDARLKDAGGQYLAAATSLTRTLLGPVAGQLGRKRLVIVADGMLHYIPFGALPDPNRLGGSDGSWQPLFVEHEVVNLPSASTIVVLRQELAGRKPAARTLAVLADPVFSKDDERISPSARLSAPQTAQPATDPLNKRILGETAGAAPGDLRIKRLPFTRQEADQILPLVPAGSGMKALDFGANRATATSDQLGQYRYVHFATHGLADSERPELSTIVLSLFDEQGRPQDGFLRAHEVYNLNLPAEMVVLSACETGLGKLTRGEGLVSLTRGFMYAGAARVVVSLWSVNDRATAELMVKFYRRVLVAGERPAAALRAAQVEMWRDKRWESPYYWAAFTLQGEWR
jgi:CHAT domain-containing protein/tetratricopeptide (TPR) repeat protein